MGSSHFLPFSPIHTLKHTFKHTFHLSMWIHTHTIKKLFVILYFEIFTQLYMQTKNKWKWKNEGKINTLKNCH